MDFSSVTISFFIHSTEDADLLMKMVRNRFDLEEPEISTEKITGYFGNEMISIRTHIIGVRAQVVAARVIEALSIGARDSIRTEIEKSLDEHDSLYLRLDRQSLQDDRLSLSDDEPIRIKLKPKSRSAGRDSMKRQYLELIR